MGAETFRRHLLWAWCWLAWQIVMLWPVRYLLWRPIAAVLPWAGTYAYLPRLAFLYPDDYCPYPWRGDDGTVKACIGNGHCGCRVIPPLPRRA